jgi:myo-inositol-1(or 4)-monophosphatase
MSDASSIRAEALAAAESWARAVGEIQLSFLTGRDKDVRHKGEIDLVTAADKAAEEYLVARIAERFPAHDYVAEEGHRKSTGHDLAWYIDPLDGTTNFAHGYPVFCVSIALVERGVPVVGVVHDPCRGETFTAVKGGGATLNGKPLAVSATSELKQAFLCSGFPYAFAKDPRNLALWGAFLHAAQSVRRDGSAALDLCYVAMGRFDGFWEYGLNSWDGAAGALVVEEAGGRATMFDGAPLDIDGRAILATNGRLHAAMQTILRDNGA